MEVMNTCQSYLPTLGPVPTQHPLTLLLEKKVPVQARARTSNMISPVSENISYMTVTATSAPPRTPALWIFLHSHFGVRVLALNVAETAGAGARYGMAFSGRGAFCGARGHQLTPGSGPRRTPRRGAAGPDASSPGSSRLPRVRVQSPHTPPAQAVEDTPDAHGGQRRPSCARVCCRTRAPCAALRAAPRTGLRIICDYPHFV
ncbi:hypothetical protein EVAR_52225_1 [Eumeta japonica]|uniref:Uncharacterized protein n=1 Tax=Eumeta variegata TaxID=151549 RepID=A0A4C1YZW9_EUMVA|nr:hypothetical protein EVAR_52225_1 [Eumeta japonica]